MSEECMCGRCLMWRKLKAREETTKKAYNYGLALYISKQEKNKKR